MKSRRFIQCDVFSPIPTQGNGLAVVVDGEGLSDQQMQAFAAWTNLAETTFILPPEDPQADYRLRIFTTTREMLFAGHPTLGSCKAWLHAGGKPRHENRVRQECGIGIVEIDVSEQQFAFVAPPTKIHDMPDGVLKEITEVLKIPTDAVLHSAILDNGPVWQVLQLESAEQVLAVDSSLVSWPEHKPVGLIGAHDADNDCDYEVRMLAPSSGMSEDPITGSLNAALAHWMVVEGWLDDVITVAQGTKINRYGRVTIYPHGDKIYIAGDTHIIIDGQVTL